ncbi:MAG: helix-turn-helix domain-containing protein [Azospirillaceae bacterium]
MPRPNPRRVKIHRSYTVEEIADLFGVHPNTVRNWLRRGLSAIDDHHPILVHGTELRRFLEQRRLAARRPCAPGEIFCLACRAPKRPDGGIADLIPRTPAKGLLRGLCPDCGTLMNRWVALDRLDAVRGDLDVAIPEAERRMGDCSMPIVKCDFAKDSPT